MTIEILQLFWHLLPAGISNMTPPLLKKINLLNKPVDFGKKYRGRRILGDHKTWRGFLFGTLAAIIFIYLQRGLTNTLNLNTIISYNSSNLFLLGFLFGFGALFGDALKSFFKRQSDIPPGKPWIPFDQIDWVFGAILMSEVYVRLTAYQVITTLVLFGLLHPVVNFISYLMGIQKNKL